MQTKVDSNNRKPRFLCLHGFRTSGEILKKQIYRKWPSSITEKLDLVFVDAPFPCRGNSEVAGIFDPPYYEWFQRNKVSKEYENFEVSHAYIEDCMLKFGPFDGFLGFSQGGTVSAALAGLQAKGLALTMVPKIKSLIIIGGSEMESLYAVENAYSSKIRCPSVHFIGETDYISHSGHELLNHFLNPVVIYHPDGHIIPRLDEKSKEMMQKFIESLQSEVMDQAKNGGSSKKKTIIGRL